MIKFYFIFKININLLNHTNAKKILLLFYVKNSIVLLVLYKNILIKFKNQNLKLHIRTCHSDSNRRLDNKFRITTNELSR